MEHVGAMRERRRDKMAIDCSMVDHDASVHGRSNEARRGEGKAAVHIDTSRAAAREILW